MLGIGACEQHGPHLPLDTDTLIVTAFADAVAERLDGVVLPTLPYGAPSRPRSGGGDLFAAPALPLELLLATVRSVVAGALQMGARKVVVLSWHWENASVLWDALRPLFPVAGSAQTVDAAPASGTAPGDDRLAVLIDNPAEYLARELRDELFPDGFPGWDGEHAGRLETALVWHLARELVGEIEPPTSYRPRGLDVLPTPADAVPANGVFVDAAGIPPDLGSRCFESIASALAGAIKLELG